MFHCALKELAVLSLLKAVVNLVAILSQKASFFLSPLEAFCVSQALCSSVHLVRAIVDSDAVVI